MSIVCSVYVCDECAARYVYDEIVGGGEIPGKPPVGFPPPLPSPHHSPRRPSSPILQNLQNRGRGLPGISPSRLLKMGAYPEFRVLGCSKWGFTRNSASTGMFVFFLFEKASTD